MSKGSKQRPRKISEKQFADNWDAIFGKKKAVEEPNCNKLDTEEKDERTLGREVSSQDS